MTQGFDLLTFAKELVSYLVVLLFSLSFHEFAHGWMALKRGDNTAKMMGRLTLNPLAHIDLVGTLILPITAIFFNSMGSRFPMFGWAKPVPVNPRNLKSPKTDMFWVALAGPASNVILAFIGALALGLASSHFTNFNYYEGIKSLLGQFIVTNLFLAFFNIIPLHPLDGGKVLARFLPAQINYKLEQNAAMSSYILLFLIMMDGLRFLVYPVLWSADLFLNFAVGIF